jgi:uncharacterized damage-inducible protein DinB
VTRRFVVASLVAQIDEAFDRRSWHGTNLRGSLRGITAARATWRPGAGRHNAWEIMLHAAYWKYVAWRRLTGEKRGAFARPGSNWFQAPASASESAWRKDLALLQQYHRALRAAVLQLSDEDLERRAPGSKETIGRLVRGIAAHDLYHAGQIQLVKTLSKGVLQRAS